MTEEEKTIETTQAENQAQAQNEEADDNPLGFLLVSGNKLLDYLLITLIAFLIFSTIMLIYIPAKQ